MNRAVRASSATLRRLIAAMFAVVYLFATVHAAAPHVEVPATPECSACCGGEPQDQSAPQEEEGGTCHDCGKCPCHSLTVLPLAPMAGGFTPSCALERVSRPRLEPRTGAAPSIEIPPRIQS